MTMEKVAQKTEEKPKKKRSLAHEAKGIQKFSSKKEALSSVSDNLHQLHQDAFDREAKRFRR